MDDFCNGKRKYDKKGAQSQRNLCEKNGRGEMRIYACPHCNHWHLSKVKFYKKPQFKKK